MPSRKKFPFELRLNLARRERYRCAHCRCEISFRDFHIDHIVPLALGGRDTVENLQALCAPCNLRKGSRFIG